MRGAFRWFLQQGIVSTFLSGLFVILPVVVTVAIIVWVAEKIQELLGPGSTAGQGLRRLGLQFVTDEITAWVIGLVLVLIGVWLLGVLVKTRARNRVKSAIDGIVGRIPIVKSVYGTVEQIVSMVNREDQSGEMAGMAVVFCALGGPQGLGMIGLLPSRETYRFGPQEYCLIYVPTSPVPMTGYITLVPAAQVQVIEMSADQMMQIYLSLGVLAPKVMPPELLASSPAVPKA